MGKKATSSAMEKNGWPECHPIFSKQTVDVVKWLPKHPELAFGDPRRVQVPSPHPTLQVFTMPANIAICSQRESDGARGKEEEITAFKNK